MAAPREGRPALRVNARAPDRGRRRVTVPRNAAAPGRQTEGGRGDTEAIDVDTTVAPGDDDVPVVVADSVLDGIEFRHVIVTCPWCARRHAHAWRLTEHEAGGPYGAACPRGGAYRVAVPPRRGGGQ